MKKSIFIISSFLSLFFTSCLKDDSNVDFTKISPFVEMPYSGRNYFSSDAVNYSSDTVTVDYTINLASDKTLDHDITVSIDLDTSLVPVYNGLDTTVHYEVMPASAYSFTPQTVTIKAGTRLDTLHITFYKAPLDPTVSYMVPVVIKSISDSKVGISGNFGIHYFHAIGNILAGTYTWAYTRYNAGDTLSGLNGASFTLDDGATTVLSPVTPTQVEVQSGYGDQNGFNVRYELSFTDSAGVPIKPVVTINADDVKNNLTPAGITLTQNAKILYADLINKHFRFFFQVTNSAGSPRTLVDEFVAP